MRSEWQHEYGTEHSLVYDAWQQSYLRDQPLSIYGA